MKNFVPSLPRPLTQAVAWELPSGIAAMPFNSGIINPAILQSCFAGGAVNYSPARMAKTAVPFLSKINPANNVEQLTVPIRGALG